MERSKIREGPSPHFASLNAGYSLAFNKLVTS